MLVRRVLVRRVFEESFSEESYAIGEFLYAIVTML